MTPPLALRCLTLAVPLQPTATLRDRVEAALQQQGHPLRWAITATQGEGAIVEAVICRDGTGRDKTGRDETGRDETGHD